MTIDRYPLGMMLPVDDGAAVETKRNETKRKKRRSRCTVFFVDLLAGCRVFWEHGNVPRLFPARIRARLFLWYSIRSPFSRASVRSRRKILRVPHQNTFLIAIRWFPCEAREIIYHCDLRTSFFSRAKLRLQRYLR